MASSVSPVEIRPDRWARVPRVTRVTTGCSFGCPPSVMPRRRSGSSFKSRTSRASGAAASIFPRLRCCRDGRRTHADQREAVGGAAALADCKTGKQATV
eukprot:1301118-Prymnesium_polylepis.3